MIKIEELKELKHIDKYGFCIYSIPRPIRQSLGGGKHTYAIGTEFNMIRSELIKFIEKHKFYPFDVE